jgi:rod shape-determining protein MreC
LTPLEQQNRRAKIIINFIIFLIALISFSKRDDAIDKTSFFENLMIDSFAPVQRTVYFVHDKINFYFSHYLANIEASKRNVTLQKKIEEMNGQLFQFQEVVKENKRLKQLLAFGEELKVDRVMAQVVSRDSSSDFRVVRINKGFSDGIRLQSPVVTDKGLVGYVFRLTDHFADVITILDQNNRVDGLVERTRSHGIIEGDVGDVCIMKYVSRTEPVILNDKVITSGLGNVYPKGILIGNISRIEREGYGITQKIEITPGVDFGRLEEVIVLTSSYSDEKKKEWRALDDQDEGSQKDSL